MFIQYMPRLSLVVISFAYLGTVLEMFVIVTEKMYNLWLLVHLLENIAQYAVENEPMKMH